MRPGVRTSWSKPSPQPPLLKRKLGGVYRRAGAVHAAGARTIRGETFWIAGAEHGSLTGAVFDQSYRLQFQPRRFAAAFHIDRDIVRDDIGLFMGNHTGLRRRHVGVVSDGVHALPLRF